jgi:hypothetical protein
MSTSNPDPQPWRTQATELVFQNRWLGVALDQVELPTGQRYEYTRLEPVGVGVAATIRARYCSNANIATASSK